MRKVLATSLFALTLVLVVGCESQAPSTAPTPTPSEAAKEDLMKQYQQGGKKAPEASQKGL